jgi:hypothetical protein
MAQEVECLPSKHKFLSSNLRTAKNKNKKSVTHSDQDDMDFTGSNKNLT